MPFLAAPAGMAIATLIGGGAVAGAGIYGAKKASGAQREAAQVSDAANREAIAFEREKEARRQQEWDLTMAQAEAQWDAEQERLAPYRAASEGALAQLVSLAGLPAYSPTPTKKPDFNRTMPKDWQPGDPTGVEDMLAKDATPVRQPKSSRLTDLLHDPGTLDRLTSMAASSMPDRDVPMAPAAPGDVTTEPTRVSEAAYQRLSVPGGSEIRSLVRARRRDPRRMYGEA